MAMTSCSECGTRHEVGYPCPTCTQVKEATRLHDEQKRLDRERSREEQRRHDEGQRAAEELQEAGQRFAREQAERQREAEKELAEEADRRHREALTEHEDALREIDAERAEEEERRLEEYRYVTANARRLQAEAEVAKASELLAAGLPSEAGKHCGSALDLDASYLPAYLPLAHALALDGDLGQSEVYFRKGLLLLRRQDVGRRLVDTDAWSYASFLCGEFHFTAEFTRFHNESLKEVVLTVCGRLAGASFGAVEQWQTILEVVTGKWAEPSLLDVYKRSLRSALTAGVTADDSRVRLLVDSLERSGLVDEALTLCTTRLSRGHLRVNEDEGSLWLTAIRLELARGGLSEDTRRIWLKRLSSSQREKVKSLFEQHLVSVFSGSSADATRDSDAQRVRHVALRALRDQYREWLPEIEASHKSDAERKGAAAHDQVLAQEPSWKIEERAKRAAKWTFWLLIILGVPVFFIAWPVAVIAWLILRYVMPGYWQQSVQARAAAAREAATREEYCRLQQNEETRWSQLLAESGGRGDDTPRTLSREEAGQRDRLSKDVRTKEVKSLAAIRDEEHAATEAVGAKGAASPALHEVHPGSNTVFCHQCGVEIGVDPGTRYCWSCGADQSEAVVQRV